MKLVYIANECLGKETLKTQKTEMEKDSLFKTQKSHKKIKNMK